MVKARIHLNSVQHGRQFVGESGSGHAVIMDDAAGNTGAKPIELALIALGGCTAFDVIAILRKMRQVVTGYDVQLQAEQHPEPPTVFTRVIIRHKLRGTIRPEALEKAVRLSEDKYCSVSAMIGKTAKIETSWEIVPEAADPTEFETSRPSPAQ